MRTIPMAAAAVLMIASGMASAQTTSPRPPGAPAPSAATAPVPRPTPDPLKQEDVSQLEGTGVYGGDNGKVGHISTVLMNPESKQIDRLVVTSGGVLGVGGHRVAIPLDKFTWDADKGAFRLPMTTANLKAMPEWAEGAETATGSSTPPRTKPPAGGGDSEK
jgi:sporulation protein YlmC with PRC-barrel domain